MVLTDQNGKYYLSGDQGDHCADKDADGEWLDPEVRCWGYTRLVLA